MTEKPNLTYWKKEKKQQYILANLDKYVLDSRGNFVHIDADVFGKKHFFIGKESVSNYEEIIEKFVSMILQNKEEWKVVLDGGYYLENQRDRRKINERGFGLEKGYKIVGELGYRKSIWKDYEKNKKWKEDWDKQQEELSRQQEEWNNAYSNPPETEPKDQEPENQPQKKYQAKEKNSSENNKKEEDQINNSPPPSEDNSDISQTNEPNQTNNQLPKPIINTSDIINNSSVAEDQINLKNQIIQVLKKNNLQTSDLPKEYHNWEKQLEQLTTKDQIAALVQKMNHQIEQKLKELKQSQKQTNNDQPFSLAGKILIGGGVIILISFVFLILVKRIRRK